MNEEIPLATQTESIKLIKNSRGYNWEIKVLSLDIDRMQQLDEEMKKRFTVTDDE